MLKVYPIMQKMSNYVTKKIREKLGSDEHKKASYFCTGKADAFSAYDGVCGVSCVEI